MLGGVLASWLGHAVEWAADGRGARERWSQHPGGFDWLVTDHDLPGLSGLELVEWLRRANFAGSIIVHASGLTLEQAESYHRFGVAAIVRKGAHPDTLLDAVAAPRRS